MTTNQILNKVNEEADVRFGDTIERLLLLLRRQHTHRCWTKECDCDYCRFINGRYVSHKLFIHRLKKRINYYEYQTLWYDGDVDNCSKLWSRLSFMKEELGELKKEKMGLQQEVL